VSKLSDQRREVRGMSMAAAQQKLDELRRQLFNLRLQHERGEVKNNRQFPQNKKEIARLMYHIGELQHEAAMVAAGELAELEPEDAEQTALATAEPKGATAAKADEADEADETADEADETDEDGA
jgi:ribosomal protein L29